MRRRFIIWFLLVLLGIVEAAIYEPPYSCQLQFPLLWGITQTDGEYVVVGRLYENPDPTIDVHRADSQWEASLGYWWSRGPWYGRVEFYDKVEYNLSVYNTNHYTGPRPSRDQYPLIKGAMQRYFDEHGLKPEDGYRTRTTYTFLPHESWLSLLRIGGLLALSLILTWVIDYAWSLSCRLLWNRRKRLGQCVHCAYDCRGLESVICPESGENHSLPVSA